MLLVLRRVRRSLLIVWYDAWLERSLGSVKWDRGGHGKGTSRLWTVESVLPLVLGSVHWQGGVVHDAS